MFRKALMNFVKLYKIQKYEIAVDVSKRSADAENLIDNLDCASNYNFKRFKIIKNCYRVLGLIKLETVCFLLRKLKFENIKILIILFLCFHKWFYKLLRVFYLFLISF